MKKRLLLALCLLGGAAVAEVRVTAIDTGANDARSGWRYVRGLEQLARRGRAEERGPAVRAYVESVLADESEALDVRVRCYLLQALSTFEGFGEAPFDVSAPRAVRERRLAPLLRAFAFLEEADAAVGAAEDAGAELPGRFLFMPESVPESARESEAAMRAFRCAALREEVRFWRWRFLRQAAACLTPEEAARPDFAAFARGALGDGARTEAVVAMVRERIGDPKP